MSALRPQRHDKGLATSVGDVRHQRAATRGLPLDRQRIRWATEIGHLMEEFHARAKPSLKPFTA